MLGEVTGNVTAREKVDIRDSGSVDGDIVSPRVAIAEGAHFRGSVDMQREGGEAGRSSRRSRSRPATQRRRPQPATPAAATPASRPEGGRREADGAERDDVRRRRVHLTDLFSMFGGRACAERGADAEPRRVATVAEPLSAPRRSPSSSPACRRARTPSLLDLGPVVGTNVTFFGEQLGCQILVEDIVADIDRHVKDGTRRSAAGVSSPRGSRRQPSSVDGILCWDVFDYLDRPAAQALATALTRMLRPDGALLGVLQHRANRAAQVYTKYIVVDDTTLRTGRIRRSRARQRGAAQSRHHQAVRGPARHRVVPAEDQPARDPVPQAR